MAIEVEPIEEGKAIEVEPVEAGQAIEVEPVDDLPKLTIGYDSPTSQAIRDYQEETASSFFPGDLLRPASSVLKRIPPPEPSPGRKAALQAGIPEPMVDQIEKRAKAREGKEFVIRQMPSFLGGDTLTPYSAPGPMAELYRDRPIPEHLQGTTSLEEELAVEGWVDKELPLSEKGKAVERFFQVFKAYDPKTDYEETTPGLLKEYETVRSGIARGWLGLKQTMDYIRDVNFSVQPMRIGDQEAAQTGVPKKDLQKAVLQGKDWLNEFLEMKVTDPVMLEVPEVGYRSDAPVPWKLLGRTAESLPSLFLSLLSGGLGGTLARATAIRGGAKEAAVAAAERVGGQRASAAFWMTLGMKDRSDQITFEAMQKGYSPEEARNLGDTTAIIGAPFDYYMNLKFFPISQGFGGKLPAETLRGQVVDSAMNMFISGGTQQAGTEFARYVTGLEEALADRGPGAWLRYVPAKDNILRSLYRSAEVGLESAVIGLPMGLALHVPKMIETRTAQNEMLKEFGIRNLGKDLDVVGPSEFYRTAVREFEVEKGEARDATNLFDSMFQEAGRQMFLTKEQAWALMYARVMERTKAIDTLFSTDQNVHEFYHKSRGVVLDSFPAKGSFKPEQILSTLKNKGVKAEELKWTNLEAMLGDAQKAGASLSRSELLTFLDNNEIKLDFVRKQKDTPPKNVEEFEEIFRAYEKAVQDRNKISDEYNATFEGDQSAGATKRTEIEPRLDAANKTFETARTAYLDASRQSQGQTQYSFVSPEGPRGKYEEWLVRWKAPAADVSEEAKALGVRQPEEGLKFSSNHWEEPNVLVHIRVDERMGQDGKPYLNVIEIQSDWHQEGREKGYTTTETEKKLPDLREAADQAHARLMTSRKKALNLIAGMDNLGFDRPEQALKAVETHEDYVERWGIKEEVHQGVFNDFRKKAVEYEEAETVYGKALRSPKEAPFSKSWPDLALKKILIEAVDRGYDRIAWQPGHMQDRFQGAGEEGRAEFYDKIILNKMLNLVRKWEPGAKVEMVKMDTANPVWAQYDRREGDFVDIPSILITPEIRNGVLGGQTLFSGGRKFPFKYTSEQADQPPVFGARQWSHQEILDFFREKGLAADEDFSFDVTREEVYSYPQWEFLQKELIDAEKFVLFGSYNKRYGKGRNFDYGVRDYYNDDNVLRITAKDDGYGGVEYTFEMFDRIEQATEGEGTFPEDYYRTMFSENLGFHPKASFTWLETGRGFIKGWQNADLSDLVHEISHFARHFFLGTRTTLNADGTTTTHNDLATVEKIFKVQNGEWTRQQEEQFAKWFLIAMREGHSPVPELQGSFDTVSKFLKKIHPALTSAEQEIKHNNEFLFAIERLFAYDTEPVAKQRELVLKLEKELEPLQKEYDRISRMKVDPQRSQEEEVQLVETLSRTSAQLAAKKNQQRQALSELRRLQDAAFKDGASEWGVKRRIMKDQVLNAEKLVAPQKYMSLLEKVWRKQRWFTESFSEAGFQTAFFRTAVRLGDQVDVFARRYGARLFPSYQTVVKDMTGEDIRWLRDIGDYKPGKGYYPNVWKLEGVEELDLGGGTRIPVPKNLEGFQTVFRQIYEEAPKQAMAQDQVRRLASGDTPKLRQSFEYTIPRMVHEDGVAFFERGGPEVDAYAEALASLKRNQEAGWTKEKILDELNRWTNEHLGRSQGGESLPIHRTRGALEFQRTIPEMYPTWVTGSGKRIDIFHSDPREIMRKMIEGDGRRLGFIRYFGQGILRNLWKDNRSLRSVLRLFGEEVEFSKKELLAAIKSVRPGRNTPHGILDGLSKDKLQKYAEEMDIDIGPSAEEMMGRLEGLTPSDIPMAKQEKAFARLRELAKEFGGIDSRAPITAVFAGIKRRLFQNIEDDVVKALQEGHRGQFGNPKDMIDLLRRIQGYPLYNVASNTAANMFRLFTTQQGVRQTSLAPLKNLFQFAANAPAVVGNLNSIKAFYNLLQEGYGPLKQRAIAAGAIRDRVYTMAADSSSALTRIGSQVRQVGEIVTGMGTIAEALNVLSAEGGRLYADQIKERYQKGGKLSALDRNHLSVLRLNDIEMKTIEEGKMDSFIYDKIIQNAVNVTQHITEPGHRKAFIESHPIAQMLFPYMSFAAGQQRLLAAHMKQVQAGWKTAMKDPTNPAAYKDLMAGIGTTLNLIGTTVGTSVLMKMLVDKVKGKPFDPDDDDAWRMLGQAMLESQLVSQATFVANPWTYGSNGQDVILNIFPHFNALAGFADFAMSFHRPSGQYGRYPWMERLGRTMLQDTPVVRAALRQIDLQAHPHLKRYEEVARTAREWKGRKEGDLTGRVFAPINPSYQPIWEAIQRDEDSEVKRLAEEYYEDQMKQLVDPAKAMERLRASLLNHRPINMNEDLKIEFLLSLPKEKRKEYWMEDLRYERMVDMIAP